MQQLHIFTLTVILAILVAGSSGLNRKCSELPTNIVDDARKAMEPFGKKWMFYKSNNGSDLCFNMDYMGNRNRNQSLATFTMYNKKADFFLQFKVEVGKGMTSWIVTGDDGISLFFHKLVMSTKYGYWCIYACEADGINISRVICGVLTNTAKKMLDDDLLKNFPDLPLKGGLKIVFNESCNA